MPAHPPKAEKRLHPRFPIGLSLDIHAKGGMLGRCRGTISDLSMGGMSFRTEADLEEGMCLYLKLDLPLEIRGEIRHMRTPAAGGMHRYGVRFHKIASGVPDASRPDRFIAARFQK